MFAAAPSQNEFLAALVADPGIDWSRINAFHMDEYIGLDPAAPTKAEAVGRTLTWDISEKCPATILRTHKDACLYLDPDSAREVL